MEIRDVRKVVTRRQLNSLTVAPVHTCRVGYHECCLCLETIMLGQQYRDRGLGRRAHVVCVTERAQERGRMSQ